MPGHGRMPNTRCCVRPAPLRETSKHKKKVCFLHAHKCLEKDFKEAPQPDQGDHLWGSQWD